MATQPQDPRPPSGSIPIPKSQRGGIRNFFIEVNRELKKVNWPAPKEATRLTGVVLAVCLLVTLILTAFDVVFAQIVDLMLRRGR
jgi:preprotein translocase subunit SecE